jgi:Protein of unknown function (DUF2961)
MTWRDLTRVDRAPSFGFGHAGWAYDAYPELETLDAGRTITVAEIEGPAAIRFINMPQLVIPDDGLSTAEKRAISARGAILEIWFDGADLPSVQVPMADFFGDGACGRAGFFSTPFVEKGPITYNCFIPMPFRSSARVTIRNETPYDIMCYGFVEWETLPEPDPSLGYFHATWRRWAFQLDKATDEPFVRLGGPGHLLGQAWSVATNEPIFRAFWFVTEGNVEYRIDGGKDPSVVYLGSECAFGAHWGFKAQFDGHAHGINFVQAEDPSLLSVFRFRHTGGLRFRDSLDMRVNWTAEFQSDLAFSNLLRYGYKKEKLEIPPRRPDRNWVDYAVTTYWYQLDPGYEHAELLPLEQRVATLLRSNHAD